jgi:SAM-dependent methyltransferase
MSVADLVAAQPSEAYLVDQHAPGESVIDDAAAARAVARPTQRVHRESHPARVVLGQTDTVTSTAIQFGRDVPDDRELRLCGDISGGKRAIELGISREQNAIAFALAGAKSIAVDPSAEAISTLRSDAVKAEVTVECHQSELADLGFATSGSVSLVVANHTLGEVDDLGRLLRQVHRVLRASHPFVISVPHPFAGVHTSDQFGSKVQTYGTVGRTISDWFVHLSRANFRVDQILELGVSEISPVPTTLLLRARKEGD